MDRTIHPPGSSSQSQYPFFAPTAIVEGNYKVMKFDDAQRQNLDETEGADG